MKRRGKYNESGISLSFMCQSDKVANQFLTVIIVDRAGKECGLQKYALVNKTPCVMKLLIFKDFNKNRSGYGEIIITHVFNPQLKNIRFIMQLLLVTKQQLIMIILLLKLSCVFSGELQMEFSYNKSSDARDRHRMKMIILLTKQLILLKPL